MKVVALAGGTGSAKLLTGLDRPGIDLTVVANVGDNVWMYGAYVCPDVDIACYTLSGRADNRGWGIRGDTFRSLDRFAALGLQTWFRLGDQDLATCMARTELLRRGSTLTQATDSIRRSLGVRGPVLPASDERVETRVVTPSGEIHLQEFWVRDRGEPEVTGVKYRGAASARPTREVSHAIAEADRVIVCPANPVSSVGPMLATPGFRGLLRSAARVVGLSPMSGPGPYSGPAGKFMAALGRDPDSVGVARSYSDFLDAIVISEGDRKMREEIEGLGVTCLTEDTRVKSQADAVRLAKVLLKA